MEKSSQTYGGTQGDISPALARDIHNGSLSNHVAWSWPDRSQLPRCKRTKLVVQLHHSQGISVTENAYTVL